MEEQKIDWEKLSFEMITLSGSAKSSAMEGIFLAKEGKFEEANEKIKSANLEIGKASHLHMDVIVKESRGEQLSFKVLFIHAEDQLLSSQTLIILAEEIIELHRKIAEK